MHDKSGWGGTKTSFLRQFPTVKKNEQRECLRKTGVFLQPPKPASVEATTAS